MRDVRPYLKHIVEEANYLTNASEDLSFERFIQSEDLKRAFVRSLEVIGEAIKNLPLEFRSKYTEIQWKEFAGLRDIVIHQYFGVDYALIWSIVNDRIPKLKGQIEDILKELQRQG